MGRARMAIAGGGAAGFFGAIACAQARTGAEIVLLEKSPELLAKVAISGGGRCNVTHHCYDVDRLVTYYPRGARELRGAFHRWQPRDTVEWFEQRGVPIKAEADGRMFPVTDASASIVDCLVREARALGVTIRTRSGLEGVQRAADGTIELALARGERLVCDRLLIATGGNKATAGFGFAASLGHAIVPPVPSLFTFHIDDPRLAGLEGLSVQDGGVAVPGTRHRQRGPVLVTHWGLSGPAVLKLSAWAARELHDRDYRFDLNVNWAGGYELQQAAAELESVRAARARQLAAAHAVFGLPQRLWERLVLAAGIAAGCRWGAVSNAAIRALAGQVTGCVLRVEGKSLFKDEFVTCGGVALREVDFRTMESKVCPGVHFAGEVLDIDGVTGGFNLQAAWTTGWLAGKAMAL
jgi:predicted Rossmann fold flavoprotein